MAHMDIPTFDRRLDLVTAMVVDQALLAEHALDIDAARRYAHQVGADPELIARVLRRPSDSLRPPRSQYVSA
jgi:hypothetical protein